MNKPIANKLLDELKFKFKKMIEIEYISQSAFDENMTLFLSKINQLENEVIAPMQETIKILRPKITFINYDDYREKILNYCRDIKGEYLTTDYHRCANRFLDYSTNIEMENSFNYYQPQKDNKDVLKNPENYDFFNNEEIKIFVIKNSFSNKWKTKEKK